MRLAPDWKLTLDFWIGGGAARLVDQYKDDTLVFGGTWMLARKNLEFGVGLTSEVFLSWRFTTVGGVLIEPVVARNASGPWRGRRSRRAADVAMVQAADPRKRDDLPDLFRLHDARGRRVAVETHVLLTIA